MRIGIPRAFYYHSFPKLWECFFEQLGHQPVVSPPSTRRTLEIAGAQTETENCLPQKLFDGHILTLLDHVDALFVPRVLSIVKGHICCPRFGALPDATRAGIARDVPLISADINATAQPLTKTLRALARTLGAGRRAAAHAARTAVAAMARHHAAQARQETPPPPQPPRAHGPPPPHRTFLLLGHPYTLRDRFIADPIVHKLAHLDVPVERMTFGDDDIRPGLILWCIFNKMYRKLRNLDMHTYAGVIQISTFNCGTDAMMTERFRRLCKHSGVPYMLLMVDEHMGKAGVDTRLEAFVDSLAWQRSAAAVR